MNAVLEQVISSAQLSGTALRAVSAVCLAIPALAAVYFGPPWFTLLVVVAAAAMAWEWARICERQPLWLICGAFYIAVPCGLLIWLRNETTPGMVTILWLFVVVWSADIGAYLAGRSIGGPKLAPRISPNKTWAGFFGGISSAGLAGSLFVLSFDGSYLVLGFWAVVVAIASQIGDLVESALKRHFGVKDSSKLIPGHGGVLDRVDALITGAIVVAVIQYLFGQLAFPWL